MKWNRFSGQTWGKYKAHLVIKEYSQEHDINYFKVFVHVVQGTQ